MKRLALFAACLAAFYPVAGVASTRTVLGLAASNSICSYTQPVDAIQLTSTFDNYEARVAGVIKIWSYYGAYAGSVAFEVWRPTGAPNTYTLVAITGSKAIADGSGVVTFHTGPTRTIPVLPGDHIGLHMAPGISGQLSCVLYTGRSADQYAWIGDVSRPRLGTVAFFDPAGAIPALINLGAVMFS